MKTKLPFLLSPKIARILSFGALCVLGSFIIGVQTAGEVQPFTHSEAEGIEAAHESDLAGDIDGNGIVAVEDAIRILEIVQGYSEPTLPELSRDPNGDSRLEVSDALRILRSMSIR